MKYSRLIYATLIAITCVASTLVLLHILQRDAAPASHDSVFREDEIPTLTPEEVGLEPSPARIPAPRREDRCAGLDDSVREECLRTATREQARITQNSDLCDEITVPILARECRDETAFSRALHEGEKSACAEITHETLRARCEKLFQ